MISFGYRNGSSVPFLQDQDTLFLEVVLLRRIYKLCPLISLFPSIGQFAFFSAVAFWPLFTWFCCDFYILSHDGFGHAVHVNVADFNYIAVENFSSLWLLGK